MDVRIEAAAPDHIAAGRRHRRTAEAREERAGQQERRTHHAAEALVGRRLRRAPGIDAHLVRTRPRRVRPEVGQEVEHRVDVPDARHVREQHRPVDEDARGENRERAVLVSGGANGAAQAACTFDDERVGERGCDCHSGLC